MTAVICHNGKEIIVGQRDRKPVDGRYRYPPKAKRCQCHHMIDRHLCPFLTKLRNQVILDGYLRLDHGRLVPG